MYVRHTKAVDTFYENLDGLIRGGSLIGKKIYMFGSSKVASMIIYYLRINQIFLEGILDNNPSCAGNRVFGLRVFRPDELQMVSQGGTEVIVLIASGHQDAMIRQLESMGFQYGKNIIKVIDLPELMEDYSFVDRSGYIPLTETEIKKSQLGILRCVKRVCEKYGYRYYLAYGTLLGAVRHQGFIPWDDDIDVFIDIRDLDAFIKAVNQEEDYAMISSIGDMDYYDVISLMYDRHTIYDSNHFPMQISAGVTIDVFPLYGLPDTREEIFQYSAALKEAELDMLNHMYQSEECNKAKKTLFALLQKYDLNESNYIGNVLGPYQFSEVFPKEWFTKTVQLPFEGEMFQAPQGWDGYLKAVYGDYRVWPEPVNRKGHHFFHAYHKKTEISFGVESCS